MVESEGDSKHCEYCSYNTKHLCFSTDTYRDYLWVTDRVVSQGSEREGGGEVVLKWEEKGKDDKVEEKNEDEKRDHFPPFQGVPNNPFHGEEEGRVEQEVSEEIQSRG